MIRLFWIVKREFSLRLVLCVVDVQSEEQQLILLQSLVSGTGARFEGPKLDGLGYS